MKFYDGFFFNVEKFLSSVLVALNYFNSHDEYVLLSVFPIYYFSIIHCVGLNINFMYRVFRVFLVISR